jgi:hypothetical protein
MLENINSLTSLHQYFGHLTLHMIMDKLTSSCENFRLYPRNLIDRNADNHQLQIYHDQLRERTPRLFNELQAAVDISDYNDTKSGMALTSITLRIVI